jgi:hypothetical protein
VLRSAGWKDAWSSSSCSSRSMVRRSVVIVWLIRSLIIPGPNRIGGCALCSGRVCDVRRKEEELTDPWLRNAVGGGFKMRRRPGAHRVSSSLSWSSSSRSTENLCVYAPTLIEPGTENPFGSINWERCWCRAF